jgi:hypothetical protein
MEDLHVAAAFSSTLPLVVVIGALTFTSRPQHAIEIAVGGGDRGVDVDVAKLR